ncbi:MAG TPA: AI-2E family transporter [Polyangiales bacterium]
MTLKPDAAHSTGAIIFFCAVLAAALFGFAYVLSEFISDLVLGFLIAGTARPLYLRTVKRLRGRAQLSAALVTAMVAFLVTVPAVLLVTSLSQQAAAAYQIIHDALVAEDSSSVLQADGWFGSRARSLFEMIGIQYSPQAVRNAILGATGAIASTLTTQLNTLVTNLIAAVYHFALIVIVVFYGLVDGPALKRRIFDLSPLPDEEEELIVAKFKDVGAAILFGSGSASLVQGTLCGLAMWVADIPSPLFWASVVAIFAFLPMVGTNLVIIPATAWLFFEDRWFAALAFFLFCNFEGLLIDNVLTPRLVGGRMQMHSLVIFLALVGGISTFGMGGLVYGPLVAAFLLTILDLYERVYRQRIFAAP